MRVPKKATSVARRVLPDSAYRRLRQRHIAGLVKRYEAWDRAGVYGDGRFTVRIADPLAEGWYGHDWPVLPEIRMLRELGSLRPGACVFDLGAHQGIVALMLARDVGPDGYVLAVEAEAHNALIAKINKETNGAENLAILHGAVTDKDGSALFTESLNGTISATRPGSVEVPAWTVDTLAMTHRPPDVVFMDIEGYEGRALPAALRTIATGASFFVEVHVETLVDATPEGVVGLFAGRCIYVAADPGDDNSYSFRSWQGETLPDRRFYLIAA